MVNRLNGARIAAGLVLLTGPLVLGHEGHDAPSAGGPDPDAPKHISPETAGYIGLKTAEVEFGSIEEVVRLTGVVRPLPERVQIVSARIAGVVTEIGVRVGENVSKGQLLGSMQSRELAREMLEASKLESEFEVAVAERARWQSQADRGVIQQESIGQRLALAESELARTEANREAVSANELAAKRASAVAAREESKRVELEMVQIQREIAALDRQIAALRKAAAALKAALVIAHGDDEGDHEGQPGLVHLRADIDGVVTLRDAVPGQGVEAGRPLLMVASYERVLVEADAPESEMDSLVGSVGKPVRLRRTRIGGVVAEGVVRSVSPSLDPVRRTARLVVEAANPGGKLLEGMLLDASIVLREAKEAVIIPLEAVLEDGPARYVFIKDGEMYKRQDIRPGARDDRFIEILKSSDAPDATLALAPGDVVVSHGAAAVAQIRPKAAAGAAAHSADDGHGHSH